MSRYSALIKRAKSMSMDHLTALETAWDAGDALQESEERNKKLVQEVEQAFKDVERNDEWKAELDRANQDLLDRLARVREWTERHAQHAGHAPLSELQTILRGEEAGR